MVGRHLLETSGTVIYIPIFSIVSLTFLIIYSICKCSASRTEADIIETRQSVQRERDIEAQASAVSSAPSGATSYPQFASSPSGGVVHVPVDFTAYSPERTPFTRAQIEAMSVDELKILKRKLNMG